MNNPADYTDIPPPPYVHSAPPTTSNEVRPLENADIARSASGTTDSVQPLQIPQSEIVSSHADGKKAEQLAAFQAQMLRHTDAGASPYTSSCQLTPSTTPQHYPNSSLNIAATPFSAGPTTAGQPSEIISAPASHMQQPTHQDSGYLSPDFGQGSPPIETPPVAGTGTPSLASPLLGDTVNTGTDQDPAEVGYAGSSVSAMGGHLNTDAAAASQNLFDDPFDTCGSAVDGMGPFTGGITDAPVGNTPEAQARPMASMSSWASWGKRAKASLADRSLILPGIGMTLAALSAYIGHGDGFLTTRRSSTLANVLSAASVVGTEAYRLLNAIPPSSFTVRNDTSGTDHDTDRSWTGSFRHLKDSISGLADDPRRQLSRLGDATFRLKDIGPVGAKYAVLANMSGPLGAFVASAAEGASVILKNQFCGTD